MNRLSLSVSLAAVLTAFPALAQEDELVIAGGGVAGRWDTGFEFANVSTEPVDVSIWIEGLPLAAPCPPNCTTGGGTIPGSGTMRLLASEFVGELYVGPQMVHVQTLNGGPVPVVHARSISSTSTCQFAELPVVRKSTIESIDTSLLVFPGVASGGGFYSNLILESLSQDAATVDIELLDADGNSLGARTVPIPGLPTFAAFTLVDVAGSFGVPTLENGQVRVHTRTATGPVWGVLATVGADGSLRVALGANP
jgi:hypothetical protein